MEQMIIFAIDISFIIESKEVKNEV